MNHDALQHAAAVIRAGGVVAYPTESCFGLGCDPRNVRAIRRILRLKHRSSTRGLILIADRFAPLRPFLSSDALPPDRWVYIFASWPGENTWLLPARNASRWLRGAHATLAVRVTAHREAARLCRLARMPLVSTSANRTGRRALRSAQSVVREFGDGVDYVVPGRVGNARAPSIIRQGATGQVVRG